jgi:hypothetical protein
MPFWSKTVAAPQWIDTWFKDRTPRFLRLLPAVEPQTPKGLTPPVRLTIDDVGPLSAFWTECYGGDDWYMDAQPAWVSTYLNDPAVIVLGAYDGACLVATIVSTPFSAATSELSNGAMLPFGSLRVIEGLCLAKQWRSRGVAGYMIGMMDCWTSTKLPVAHLWARETSSAPFMSTALRTDTYAMLRTKDAVETIGCSKMDWLQFTHLWHMSVGVWNLEDGEGKKPPCIFSKKPVNRSGAIDVWMVKQRPDMPMGLRQVVVVLDSRRRTIPGDERIFEVIWCGFLTGSKLKPAQRTGSFEFSPFLESIATNYKDAVLFASSGAMGGGANSNWGKPWRYGCSGAHSWYMYNYMPPAFGSCEIMAIRDEI